SRAVLSSDNVSANRPAASAETRLIGAVCIPASIRSTGAVDGSAALAWPPAPKESTSRAGRIFVRVSMGVLNRRSTVRDCTEPKHSDVSRASLKREDGAVLSSLELHCSPAPQGEQRSCGGGQPFRRINRVSPGP